MFGVLQGFVLILGVIAAGYIASRTGIVRGDQRLVLNKLAFYVATPALLFGVLHDADPGVVLSPVIMVTTLSAVTVALVYVVASRLWFKRDIASTTLGATASGYVNSNNLGLPVAIYILGDALYVAPVLLVQLVLFTPVVLAILESTRGNRGGALTALGRAASNPIIIGSLLGFVCALVRLPIPEIVMGPIDMVGQASIPMILMSFGISLHGQRALQPGSGRIGVLGASALKVIGMPLAAWTLSLAFGLSPHETFIATTIGALPTAQNVFNYAATYKRAEVQVRDTVFVTTFASLPVIAAIAWLLGGP